MVLTDAIAAFLSTPSGIAGKGLLILTFVVFALGVFAAVRDSTFEWKYVDSFVRTTIAGKVLPVLLLLFVGYLAGDPLFTAPGLAAAAVVTAGMASALWESLKQLGLSKAASAKVNEKPT